MTAFWRLFVPVPAEGFAAKRDLIGELTDDLSGVAGGEKRNRSGKGDQKKTGTARAAKKSRSRRGRRIKAGAAEGG
ncbi:MAG: hypothetical protein LBJ64_08435 [Deltaproteobacteria bacterium]|nr:hypothetical protein [Deltaproteobacteria bacterium]